MTDFDKATYSKSNKTFPCTIPCDLFGVFDGCIEAKIWRIGRNSVKESMEIMARALKKYEFISSGSSGISQYSDAAEAIAQVKANSDWPL